ncbi:unnamed protein product [Rhizoctonia solani]|uniref:Uncharacterized protein n=1 Tax=Rhizoctonia solani TaxID=456999 RepID=A0A8H3D1R5_9AGAM|nr:unnamed protein product [Rhizoctonia solani]
MHDDPRIFDEIASNHPQASYNILNYIGNGHKTTGSTRQRVYADQGRGTATFDASTNQFSQSHFLHQASNYSRISTANNISARDMTLITQPDTNKLCFTPYSATRSYGLTTDDGHDFSSGLTGALLFNSQNISIASYDDNTLETSSSFEKTLGLLPGALDEHKVAQLSAISTSELSQGNQFDSRSGLQSSCGTTEPNELVPMPHTFNRLVRESPTSSSQMTPAQASLFSALLSLGEPLVNANSLISHPSVQISSSTVGSQSQPIDLMDDSDGEDEDPERIQTIICGRPVLDRNTESNSLPFVLHSYAIWMRKSLFDPSRAASRTRDYVIRHFSESTHSRSRTILFANIFRSIATNPAFSLNHLPKLSALRTTIQGTLTNAASRKTNPSRDVQIRESIRALEQTLELLAASRCESLDICLQLLRDAAPVFRRACPEPVDQLVHLPSILMHPNANMRHYPVMDVYFSIITGLPTNLQYDTSLRSPIDSSVLYIDNHLGLSWMYGQPDGITLILARINSLYQNFGTKTDVGIIQEIEQDIQSFKVISGRSPDPSLLVMRLVVQECWRQVAYIYLYMTLCDADVFDARVRTAQQRLIGLVSGTQPALALDMHLAPCLGIAGVVTHLPAEREAILARLRGLPECSRFESCLSCCIRILEGLWRQADRENRPVKWVDLRLGTLRVLGIQ